MAAQQSTEEIVERAKRLQGDRIVAIRTVGETRQKLTSLRTETDQELAEVQGRFAARIAEAERAYMRALRLVGHQMSSAKLGSLSREEGSGSSSHVSVDLLAL